LQIGNATHNRAGEITYVQTDNLSIIATITVYAKESSPIDQDSLELFWGDGTSEFVVRDNGGGAGVYIGNDTRLNIYIANHIYPSTGTYTMGMYDPNRTAGILNVNYPNSVNVPFYIETTFTFLNPQFQGFNSSVILLQPPVDKGCVGQRFIHNANAYDVDKDSLSYELIAPLMDQGQVVPKYFNPDEILPGPDNDMTLDPITGDLIWEYPQMPGEYNVAFYIHEYRNGVLLNSIIRDLQIYIGNCNNAPPKIEVIEEHCVIAGELIEIDILVTDPDIPVQNVKLTALGGPLLVADSAYLLGPDDYVEAPLSAKLMWQTTCNHISGEYYQIILKAEDNFFGMNGSVDLKTIYIKVSGPPPKNLDAESENNDIRLSWNAPYTCEDATVNKFIGFSVWRKVNSKSLVRDTCETGLENKGYEQIAFMIEDTLDGDYTFLDEDVPGNNIYCYRIEALFALISPGGYPYNISESLFSDEVCILPRRDMPLITKASVSSSSTSDGINEVEWIAPDPLEVDTIVNPGPYSYRLKRSEGIGTSDFQDVSGSLVTDPSFNGLGNRGFTVLELNTEIIGHSYQVDFFTSGNINTALSSSLQASTPFLILEPADRSIVIKVDDRVPWSNYEYVIYKKEMGMPDFDSLTTTPTNEYIDRGLNNGEEYCYYVKTIGDYNLPDVPAPLINFTQIACSRPEDTQSPCIPLITVTNVCDLQEPVFDEEDFVNEILWSFDDTCSLNGDLDHIQIFYSIDFTESYTQVGEPNHDFNGFEHENDGIIEGCYYLRSVDSVGNISAPSDTICVTSCPIYSLPNTFTPNDDGQNELFKPFPFRFVPAIDMKIFNRWGQLVFETTDPEINWNGENLNGKPLPSGVYYYKCMLETDDLDIENKLLTGFIELIRN
jgi:gliding motility-associated-like protein